LTIRLIKINGKITDNNKEKDKDNILIHLRLTEQNLDSDLTVGDGKY
jgi:hypothetical protein